MDTKFNFKAASTPEPVRIEQVFAEKPGGGLVESASYDILPTTAVAESNGIYKPIKAYRLYKAVTATDTSIQIEKGSGVAVGDFIGTGKKAVACTAVDTSNDEYDLVTVTLGVAVAVGAALYQAKAASTANVDAEPIYTPQYVIGNLVPADHGKFPVRLINGANLRKETANVASEVAALLPLITLV